MPDFWNVLHDGSILAIEGEVPGDMRLGVAVAYLHELWQDSQDYLYIDLMNCTLFEWHVFGKDDQIIVFKDLKTIAQSKAQIRSAVTVENLLRLHIHGIVEVKDGQQHPFWHVEGELHIRYKALGITLGNGQRVTLDEFKTRAADYWKRER